MNAEQWQLLEEHFEAALQLDPEERAHYVERVCTHDSELRSELTSLLRAHGAAAGFLETREAGITVPVPADALKPGARVGAWRIVRLIGRGGMGEVYEAERADAQYEQRAALKLTRLEQADLLPRFNAERQILARFEHPGIARLLDGGVASDGRPYAVMEYVEGQPVTDYCEAKRCSLPERLSVFVQVCDAVAHAHRNLIVHRDLKPGNVLVDASGRARLLDFGIAKPLDAGIGGGGPAGSTTALLTPDYAAPEQLAGEPITTGTDVYALGVILCELLTGRKPWVMHGLPFARAVEMILERPAPRISEIARQRADSPIAARLLQGDLDEIVAKCLRREVSGRYPTVEALVDDVNRHVQGRPVAARSGSSWYRFSRFVRRNRLPVAASALVLLAILAGGAGALWQARIAREEAHRAEAVQEFLISIFRANSHDQPDPVKARNTTARELLAAGAERLERDRSLPPAARERLYGVIARMYSEMDLRESAVSLTKARIAHLRKYGNEAQLARALVDLAEDLQESHRREEALPVLREAERLALAQRPMNELLVGHIFSYLSNQLSATDRSAATDYAERAANYLRHTDPQSEEMLGALFMLYQAKRETEPRIAEQRAREALEVVRALHGEQHTLFGVAALMLADIQSALFDNANADRNYRLAENVVLRSTDPHHYSRLQLDLRYGLFLFDSGQLDAGSVRLERALAAAVAKHGEEDRVYTAWAWEYLGRAAFQRGDLSRARECVERSLTTRRAASPSDLLAKTAELLFDIELAAGNVSAAAAYISESRAAREHVGSAQELGFREGLLVREAELALANGDAARSTALFTQVLDAVLPPLQQFQRYRISAWVGRARAATALSRFDSAMQDAQAAISAIEELHRPPQLGLWAADAWMQLGALHALRGECAKADSAWSRGLESLQAASSPASFRLVALKARRESAGRTCREVVAIGSAP